MQKKNDGKQKITSNQCIFESGEDVLYQRGLENVDIAYNLQMLFVWGTIYRFLAFLGMWLCYRNRKPWHIIKDTFGMS